MATEVARRKEAEAAEEAGRLEAQVDQLTRRIHAAQEECIRALEERDKDRVKMLEEEIKAAMDRREGLDAVARRLRKEDQQRRSITSHLITIIYTSTFATPMTIEDVGYITQKASLHNRRIGVTSALLFNLTSSRFYQVLEGDAEVVDKLYVKIVSDKRHRDVVLLRRQLIDARRFPHWPMQIINVEEYDKEEQPIQTVMSLLAQHAEISDHFLQCTPREVMLRGGNPLFLQPKRTKVVTMMLRLHHSNIITDSACPPKHLITTLNTFLDIAARCIAAHNGILVKTMGDLIHAQWLFTQLRGAKEAAEDIIAAMAELRSYSQPSSSPDAPEQLTMCGWSYPCIAITAGAVVVNKQSTPTQTSIDIFGPPVNEGTNLLQLGVDRHYQLVTSPVIAHALSSAQQFRFSELTPPKASSRSFGVDDFPTVPHDLASQMLERMEYLGGLGKMSSDPSVYETIPPPVHFNDADVIQASKPNITVPRDSTNPPSEVGTSSPLEYRVTQTLLSDKELREQFDKLDVNKNGFISKDEFKDFYDLFDAMGVYDMYDKIDDVLQQYNMLGDDKLSYDEFCILMLKLAQH